jgi:hypothetical protein
MLFGNKRTSASVAHNDFHNVGLSCDHGEQNPRGAVRPGAALFPVPQRRRRDVGGGKGNQFGGEEGATCYGYAMDSDHNTLTAGFECHCPAATWAALRQPDVQSCEGSAFIIFDSRRDSRLTLHFFPAAQAAAPSLAAIQRRSPVPTQNRLNRSLGLVYIHQERIILVDLLVL